MKNWLADPENSPEELKLRARLLDIVLVTLLISAAAGLAASYLVGYRETAGAILVAMPVLLIAYGLSRRQRVAFAGLLLVAVMQALATYILFVGYGTNDNAIILYALNILVASLVLNRFWYVLFVLVAVGNGIWLVYGELSGALTFDAPKVDSGMLITVPVMLLACALVARVMSENLRRSLIRARVETEKLAKEVGERQRAEAEQRRLIGELEHFAHAVSHDLKSPLLTIRGHLGFMEQDAAGGDMDRFRAGAALVDEAAAKMQRLLDELRELSRVGRVANPRQEMPFGELAEEAVRLVAGRLAERRTEVHIARDLPRVHVDRPRLVSVLQNLIENAIKFLGDQTEPRIEVGAEDGDEGPVFFVRDNGIGIEKSQQETIFGLFERLDSSVEGSGMGLALAKRIVEVHGGRIWAESQGRGTGTTFRFTLGTAAAPGG